MVFVSFFSSLPEAEYVQWRWRISLMAAASLLCEIVCHQLGCLNSRPRRSLAGNIADMISSLTASISAGPH